MGFPHSSAGKESACNAGDPGSIPGSRRSAGEEMATTPIFLGFPGGSASKESACNTGDLGLIPGLGRSPGEGKGYPLQYSGLENSMDHREFQVHRVAELAGLSLSLHLLQYCFCFVFLCFFTARHVGSQFPNQGSNLPPPHWEVKSEPLDHQGSPDSLQYYNTLFMRTLMLVE